MSQLLDTQAQEHGTKFLIYAQNKTVPGFEKPEIVYINASPGSIQTGPEDERMYVFDARDKKPFGLFGSPPFIYRYEGAHESPVQPNSEGHFDHVRPGERAFSAATMYATVRRVMEIWEDYFGRRLSWPWANKAPERKLLLIPRVEWNNAHSSPDGFLEFGFTNNPYNTGLDYSDPYCENFDVLAHEIGHTIKNSVIGIPNLSDITDEYWGHHEAFADLVSIVATLHFNNVVDHLLNSTKGNLFSPNELSRVGELRNGRAIRIAFNNKTMSAVGREEHDLSEPFTGGAFDILVEMFQINLIEGGLISKQLGDQAYNEHFNNYPEIQQQFATFYLGNEMQFKNALLNARDKFGKLMAMAWSKTSPKNLTYANVLHEIINADKQLNGGKFEQTIYSCFDWRKITTETVGEFPFETHVINELQYTSYH